MALMSSSEEGRAEVLRFQQEIDEYVETFRDERAYQRNQGHEDDSKILAAMIIKFLDEHTAKPWPEEELIGLLSTALFRLAVIKQNTAGAFLAESDGNRRLWFSLAGRGHSRSPNR